MARQPRIPTDVTCESIRDFLVLDWLLDDAEQMSDGGWMENQNNDGRQTNGPTNAVDDIPVNHVDHGLFGILIGDRSPACLPPGLSHDCWVHPKRVWIPPLYRWWEMDAMSFCRAGGGKGQTTILFGHDRGS